VATSPLQGQQGSEGLTVLGLKARGEGAQTLLKARMFNDLSHEGKERSDILIQVK